jgi:hypothetical protein
MVKKGAEKSKTIVRKYKNKKSNSKVPGKNKNADEIDEESFDSKGS